MSNMSKPKDVYALQAYRVGNKNAGSLAVVIPAEVVKQCEISTSTIFALRVDPEKKRIIMSTVASSS
jgi:hypothetical protein